MAGRFAESGDHVAPAWVEERSDGAAGGEGDAFDFGKWDMARIVWWGAGENGELLRGAVGGLNGGFEDRAEK